MDPSRIIVHNSPSTIDIFTARAEYAKTWQALKPFEPQNPGPAITGSRIGHRSRLTTDADRQRLLLACIERVS